MQVGNYMNSFLSKNESENKIFQAQDTSYLCILFKDMYSQGLLPNYI